MSDKYLKKLKNISFDKADGSFSLHVIHRASKAPDFHYAALRVETEEKLKRRIIDRLASVISESNGVRDYDFETPDLDEGTVLVQPLDGATEFKKISAEVFKGLDNEKVQSEEQLSNSYGYVIQWESGKDVVLAFRRAPEKWNIQKLRSAYSAIFKANQLLDIESETVFRIDRNFDFIAFDDRILILDKKGFERGVNFRVGMENKRDQVLQDFHSMDLFVDLEPIKQKCGSNLRYLRRLATIEKAGYYRDRAFLSKLPAVCEREKWDIPFQNGKIMVTEQNLDSVLSVLANNRLSSLINGETFDVDSKRKYNLA